MPRFRRQTEAGTVQHVISRFVNREYRLDAPGARGEYLWRAGIVFGRCDWQPVAFALMSSHVHWALLCGSDPSDAWVRPLHVGFAGWLNRRQGRLGPVFADRHRTVTCRGEAAAHLIAYIHNNPVRAGTVHCPSQSGWTSHRALIGAEPAPTWLDVPLALRLSGYDDTPKGRARFHEMVTSRMLEPASAAFSGTELSAHRRNARKTLGAPVEIATPSLSEQTGRPQLRVPVVVHQQTVLRVRWTGTPTEVIAAVSHCMGVDARAVVSKSRVHAVSRARQMALVVWSRHLHGPAVTMAQALGMSSAGASYLRYRQ